MQRFVTKATSGGIDAVDTTAIRVGDSVIVDLDENAAHDTPANRNLFVQEGFGWSDSAREKVWFGQNLNVVTERALADASLCNEFIAGTSRNTLALSGKQFPLPLQIAPEEEKRRRFYKSVLIYVAFVLVLATIYFVYEMFFEGGALVDSSETPLEYCNKYLKYILGSWGTYVLLIFLYLLKFVIKPVTLVLNAIHGANQAQQILTGNFKIDGVEQFIPGGRNPPNGRLLQPENDFIRDFLQRGGLPAAVKIPENVLQQIQGLQEIKVFVITSSVPKRVVYLVSAVCTPMKFEIPKDSNSRSIPIDTTPKASVADWDAIERIVRGYIPGDGNDYVIYATCASLNGWSDGTVGLCSNNRWVQFAEPYKGGESNKSKWVFRVPGVYNPNMDRHLFLWLLDPTDYALVIKSKIDDILDSQRIARVCDLVEYIKEYTHNSMHDDSYYVDLVELVFGCLSMGAGAAYESYKFRDDNGTHTSIRKRQNRKHLSKRNSL
ncbi:MAG: hypothetical protein Q4D38_07840 [Planctomycetia bacterium]|nr:hypothetical protein [Planctomycetia bacterium]